MASYDRFIASILMLSVATLAAVIMQTGRHALRKAAGVCLISGHLILGIWQVTISGGQVAPGFMPASMGLMIIYFSFWMQGNEPSTKPRMRARK